MWMRNATKVVAILIKNAKINRLNSDIMHSNFKICTKEVRNENRNRNTWHKNSTETSNIHFKSKGKKAKSKIELKRK